MDVSNQSLSFNQATPTQLVTRVTMNVIKVSTLLLPHSAALMLQTIIIAGDTKS